MFKELFPDKLPSIFLAIVRMFVLRRVVYFPFSVCFGNLDLEYPLQWGNEFTDEEVGGEKGPKTWKARQNSGFFKGRIFPFTRRFNNLSFYIVSPFCLNLFLERA